MSKYLPKAERMFQEKLKKALAPEGYIHDLGGSWEVLGDEGEIAITHYRAAHFDFNYVAELFQQYAGYLQLCEDERDVSAQADAGGTAGTLEGLSGRVHGERADDHVSDQREDSVSSTSGVGSEGEGEATLDPETAGPQTHSAKGIVSMWD